MIRFYRYCLFALVFASLSILNSSCKSQPRIHLTENDYWKAFQTASNSNRKTGMLPNGVEFGVSYNEVRSATAGGLPKFVLLNGKGIDVDVGNHVFDDDDGLVIFAMRLITSDIEHEFPEVVNVLNQKYNGVSYVHTPEIRKVQSWFDNNVEIRLSKPRDEQGLLIEYIDTNGLVK